MARYYIRCRACLAVGAVESDRIPAAGSCACGGGRIEVMGRVSHRRLVHDGAESPCDARCTNARGPSCDCSCGGVNHGSKALIAVTYDAGAVPRYELQPDTGRAEEYAIARAFAESRLERLNAGDIVARKLRGDYLAPGEFRAYLAIRRAHQAMRKIEGMRTHAGRLKSLRELGAKLSEATA